MLGASTDLSKISNVIEPRKKILRLEKNLAEASIEIQKLRDQQEEFKEEFVKIQATLIKANVAVNLAASNCIGLAQTQAMIATEIVRINSGLEDLIETLTGPENQISLRFFSDDDICN